ncbi:putative MFS family arabinose efflux permease [Streptomyces sp. KhCrAH-43]|uniref:MFS transporter n=1 Tax=unclassified Streptomyces TaxID=2593676 RepID=UPI0003795A65|nr:MULTISPECIES: MFS transporter [unclassified Streptomyces]MYS35458.1 MFS transporter [Streptomyces sp. SID4920]MYX64765.1 MFS transporter [Streptomyces sp. SID8373]RAJ65267.1 putative MFS family arabinose efflux permease [Streptomyces sp. KhCrAH-43]
MGMLTGVPRTVRLLAFGAFFNAMVSFTFVYLFVYLTGPRGLSVPQAGLLTGIGGVGLVAGNFTGGWFGDRYGHRRMLLLGACVGGAVLVALPVLPLPALYAVLPLAQYATGVVRAANSALVAVSVPGGRRRQSFALTRFAANGGFTVGPPLGALIAARFSYDWLFLADGAGTLLFACYAARILPARGTAHSRPAPPPPGTPGLWRELRAGPAVPVLLAAIVCVDLVYRQQYSTLPVFLADHGHGTAFYGWLIAVNGGVILCLELPAAHALRARAPLGIVGTGLMLVGAGYALLIPGAGAAFAVLMMVSLTLGEILYKTTATAYVADQAPPHAQGRFQSLYAGASISGQVLAPPLGGALYATAPALLWPACAVLAVLAGCAVLAARRLPMRAGPVPAARRPDAETGSPARPRSG